MVISIIITVVAGAALIYGYTKLSAKVAPVVQAVTANVKADVAKVESVITATEAEVSKAVTEVKDKF